LSPDLPQPVDIGMVQPEDRVESGGVRVGHNPRKPGILRIAAPDQTVHPVMRLRFKTAVRLAAMLKSRVDSTKSRVASTPDPSEIGIGHRIEVYLINRHINVAVVIRPISLVDEEWIVMSPCPSGQFGEAKAGGS
jgi:hypothetical protein